MQTAVVVMLGVSFSLYPFHLSVWMCVFSFQERKGSDFFSFSSFKGDIYSIISIIYVLYMVIDTSTYRPFHSATCRYLRRPQIYHILQTTQMDVNDTDNFGFTPLHMASLQGNDELVDILIEAGADVHSKTTKDWTALHLACYSGSIPCFQRLQQSQADMFSQTKV